MEYTAIVSVGGTELTVQPSSMEVELESISASDAGRTADTVMHKKTLREVVAISLAWSGLRTAQARTVLSLFMRDEYFTVRYLDPYVGGYTTKTFYLGNRTAPLYNAALDIWENISFKIIER